MTFSLQPIRGFAHEHDDIPAFHAVFLVTTFLAAAIFSLGFFVLLVLLHMCLDYVKYRDFYRFSYGTTLKAMLLESSTDIALIVVSLTFAVYLSHDFMLVATSGFLRSELSLFRSLGVIIPKITILEHTLSIVANIHAYFHTVHPSLHQPYTRAQKLSLYTITVGVAMLLGSLVFYSGHYDTLLNVLARELSLSL